MQNFIFRFFIILFSLTSFASQSLANPRISPEKKLEKSGYQLPPVPKPLAKYSSFIRYNNKIYVSGQLPIQEDKLMFKGKLGDDISDKKAIEATKLAALNVIAQIKAATGNLRKVKKIVKLKGYFNTSPNYSAHYKIMDAASDIFTEAFGPKGNHARVAIGASSLPFDSPVMIEAVVEVQR